MSTLTFDTLSASRILTVPQKQAEAVTQVIKQAQDAHLEELATKGDIALVRKDVALVRKDIESVEARLEGKLTLVQWMLAVIITVQVLPLLKVFFGSGM